MPPQQHQPSPCSSSSSRRRSSRRRRRPELALAQPPRSRPRLGLLASLLLASQQQHIPLLPVTNAQTTRGGFDPYALNGGLVAAVAGPDYCVLASDTRLTDGGYQIRSRSYLGGRVWAATDPRYCADATTSTTTSSSSSSSSLSGTSDTSAHRPTDRPTDDRSARIFELDGSLRIPQQESAVPILPPSSSMVSATAAAAATEHTRTAGTRARPSSSVTRRGIANPYGLTLVGSAGCASDCEQLKRVVRTELAGRGGWARPSASAASVASSSSFPSSSSSATSASASTVATLLLHTLYARRPFPYYAFCVLAGLDAATGTGQVHVYDAIGSHERVAVACAGTPGREMLQPVLDRMFASPPRTSPPRAGSGAAADGSAASTRNGDGGHRLIRDGTALEAAGQRVGSLSLRPPVGTHVNCDADEAVALLVKAYRSVSEREIGTGDDLVVCVLRRRAEGGGDGAASVEVMRFPLKKH